MERSSKKSFKIVTLTLSVIAAALILGAGTAIIFAFEGAWGTLLGFPIEYYVCVVCLTLSGAVLAILGGVLDFCNKKYAPILSLSALVLQIIHLLIYGFLFGTIVFWIDYAFMLGNVLLLVSVAVLAVAVCFAEKPKGFYTAMLGPYIGMLAGAIMALYWTRQLLMETDNAVMFIIGFIITGIIGGGFGIRGGMISLYKKDGFALTVSSLFFLSIHFVLFCIMLSGIHFVLLGICGLAVIIIGGLLIVDSHENGFLIVAVGIISLLVWLFLLALENWVLLIAALMVIFALIMLLNGAFTMRKRATELLNGKAENK